MAPKKRTIDGEKRETRSVAAPPARATRSQTANGKVKRPGPLQSSPRKKKARTPTPKETKRAEETSPEVPEQAEQKPTKEAKKKVHQVNNGDSSGRTVVIEFCKQCKQFKLRAEKVRDGLEKAVPGISVLLNPTLPPRRGCFEVREKGGEIFISLLDMKRPFKPMKDLDMDEVVADIVGKLIPS